MKFDPYRVLGVGVTATYAEIKAAHRALAKQYHPDAGGDADQFAKINLAWSILKDVEKRNEYDDTGDAGLSGPDNLTTTAVGTVVSVICTIVEVLTGQGRNPKSFDIIEHARQTIRKKISVLEQETSAPSALLEATEGVVERIKKASDNANLLVIRALKEQVDHLRENVKVKNEEIAVHRLAYAMLHEFKFDVEKPVMISTTLKPDYLQKGPTTWKF